MKDSYYTHVPYREGEPTPGLKAGLLPAACPHKHKTRLEATSCMAETYTTDPSPRWVVQLFEIPLEQTLGKVENLFSPGRPASRAEALDVTLILYLRGKELTRFKMDRREATAEALRVNLTSKQTKIKAEILG